MENVSDSRASLVVLCMTAFNPGAPERIILHVSPCHIETQYVAAVVTFSLNHIQIPGTLIQNRIIFECSEGAES